MGKTTSYDFIIVGAGTAGCVLANRLTADPGIRVLLIEAGGHDRHLMVSMPAACPLAARDKRFDWGYVTEPEPHLNGRQILEHRGRLLGGSSSVNGMVANRGNPRDYDQWASEGLDNWSYDHCLPYFRRMETFEHGGNPWRGGSGPQHIEMCPATHPYDQAFLRAGAQAGYHICEDHNGAHHEGFHVAQSFTHHGRRWSAASGFLEPAIRRPTLTVKTGALAHRVVFDGRRAVGIDVDIDGQIERFEADHEVLVCGGAINSPQLLLLSGVGDPGELAEHGIPVVADVPQVGRNLEDHMIVEVSYGEKQPLSLSHKLKGLGRYRLGLEWLLLKTGVGTSILTETGCFFTSSDHVDYCDIQHEFYAMTAFMGAEEANVAAGFMFSMGIMRPESRGRVWLKSADPHVHPAVLFNYLDASSDREVMTNALKRTREMAAQPAFDPYRGEEMSPGIDVQSDDEILTWLREAGDTEYHPCSTCRMGTGDDSVTDATGKVHETEGLRVIDASIMPHNVTANLNAPVMMIAEKLADVVIGQAPLPPSQAPVHRPGL
ncbi:MAG: choline dehydrogenase [Rhodospirillaceae bacterium]|nr:choline dehydrogenase [Rhodospirillaceae bacterium]|tara:strand:+ start:4372 stop:6012 length:1641 start_codon:yes stop_codon:yes gene_type:complete